MDIKIKIAIKDADTDALEDALLAALTARETAKTRTTAPPAGTSESAQAPAEPKPVLPSEVHIKADDIEVLTKEQKDKLKEARMAHVQAPAPPAPVSAATADDGFTDGDGIGQTFSPDAETPAETEAALDPVQKHAPEAAPAAAKSALTLDELRKHFTTVSKDMPGARQKVSEILVAAGARSLSSLPEDKYDWALGELETWVKEQTA